MEAEVKSSLNGFCRTVEVKQTGTSSTDGSFHRVGEGHRPTHWLVSLVNVQHAELCWVTVSPDNASPCTLTGFLAGTGSQSPLVWTFPPHCPSVLISSRHQQLDRHQSGEMSVSVDAVVLMLTTGACPGPLLITRQRCPAEAAERRTRRPDHIRDCLDMSVLSTQRLWSLGPPSYR